MPVTTPLSTLLRERTAAVHERAERSAFVAALVGGALPLAGYVALVAQHRAIYGALERHAERLRADPVAGPVVFEELMRVPHLDADLGALLGPSWQRHAADLVVPATVAYVGHLDATLPARPGAFVAHHYVRYLGDLSGGQILRRSIERTYATTGTGFYRFDGIGRVKPFRDRYREVLDALPLDDAGRAEVADEAVVAFELNRAVFDDLAAAHC